MTRKMFEIDLLHQVFGPDALKKLEDARRPPPERAIFTTQEVARAQQQLALPRAERDLDKLRQCALVFYAFLISDGRTEARACRWVENQAELAGDVQGPAVARAPRTRRPRGKITDPKLLAQRNEALAKARAIRAERLAAARAETESAEQTVAVG